MDTSLEDARFAQASRPSMARVRSSSGNETSRRLPSRARNSSFKKGNTSYGGDDVVDSSITNMGEITFDDVKPVSAQTKSMVDVFLSEESDKLSAARLYEPERGISSTKKWAFYLCCVIAFVIIFITFGLGGSNMKGTPTEATPAPSIPNVTEASKEKVLIEEKSEPISNPADGQPVDAGVHVDMNRPQAMEAYVLEMGVSSPDVLNNEESPQVQALNWIASQDSAELDIPGYEFNVQDSGSREEQSRHLLQRYALGCLYFSIEAYHLGTGRNLQEAPTTEEKEKRLSFDSEWTVKEDVCEWFGVICNEDKYVTELRLNHALLSGQLVPEIFQLKALPDLVILDVGYNNLNHKFPTQLIVNTGLRELRLDHNGLVGEIDPIVKQFPQLLTLDLQDNKFSGTLPEKWSQLSALGEY